MRKILATLAAASAAALIASSASAACLGHDKQVTASVAEERTSVMSTYDGATPVVVEEKADEAKAAPAPCAEGQTDCEAPAE